MLLKNELKQIEDPDSDRTFVRDSAGNYYEEIDSPLGRKYLKKLEIPLVVRRDIQECVKDGLMV